MWKAGLEFLTRMILVCPSCMGLHHSPTQPMLGITGKQWHSTGFCTITHSLLFINDLLITNCPLHSYADDSTLHYSISFNRGPTQQELHNSRLNAATAWPLTFLLFLDEARGACASKTQFLHYQLDNLFQTSIPYSLKTHACLLLQQKTSLAHP